MLPRHALCVRDQADASSKERGALDIIPDSAMQGGHAVRVTSLPPACALLARATHVAGPWQAIAKLLGVDGDTGEPLEQQPPPATEKKRNEPSPVSACQ